MKKLVSLAAVVMMAATGLIAASQLPAAASGTLVQSTGCYDYTGFGSAGCSFTSFVSSGDLVVVYAAWKDTSTASADDSNSTGCLTAVGSAASWGDSSGYRQKIWYCPNASSLNTSITVHFSGTPSWVHIIMAEVSGMKTSGVLGQQALQASDSRFCNNNICVVESGANSTPALSPTTTSDLVFGFYSVDGTLRGCSGNLLNIAGGVLDGQSEGNYAQGGTGGAWTYSPICSTTTAVAYGAYLVSFHVV